MAGKEYRVRLHVAAICLIAMAPAGAVHAQCVSEASPYGINAHAPQGTGLNPLLNEVQACGIGWIRVDFVWEWVEPSQNNFSWSMYDSIAAAAAARGLWIFATIGGTPAWATDGTPNKGVPRSPADFYDVCFRSAQRYQSTIKYWGMWNEPNLGDFWEGSRTQYINDILKNGADAIHAGNPNAKVCGPELAHLSSGSWDSWLTDVINQAGSKLDVVTHHGYSSSGNGGVTDKLEKPPVWPWDPPSVKQVLQNTGWFGKPFWLTETGWQSGEVGESNQASYYTGLLTDWFTGQANRNWVHKIFFYELSDSQAFSQYSFGILGQDPTYPRKPAFNAYQSFITAHPPPPAPPGQASNPNPAHQATRVGTTPTLSWTAAPCATSYKVYFGSTSPGTFRGSQTQTTFSPGRLTHNTTWYWRIDAVNVGGTTTGSVWRFTTAPFPGDFDADGDVDLSDFGHLQACLTGPAQNYGPGCADADLTGDQDVDIDDIIVFRQGMAGPL